MAVTAYAELAVHGGDLPAARRRFPEALQPWLDLSTGINARPYPVPDLPPDVWARLPIGTDVGRLEQVAARRYGAQDPAGVVAAPGTQAIIQHLPALAKGRHVRVLGPTYREFEEVLRRDGRQVAVVGAVRDLAGADTAVVVNPNNPDGRIVPPHDLARLADDVGLLVVDEAFADALPPNCSMLPLGLGANVVVLRSFGKFYGLAGLRLGFAITAPDRAAALRRLLGPWAVGGPAIAIGTAALADARWSAATRERLKTDGERLDRMLGRIGTTPVGGTPLFRLVRHPAAADLFTSLAARGILTRPYADHREWLRFGLPGLEADWDRLGTAFDAISRQFS